MTIDSPTDIPSSDEQGAWDSEGGHLPPPSPLQELGITRTFVETFSVGAYRDTNLANAIVQARRERSRLDASEASP